MINPGFASNIFKHIYVLATIFFKIYLGCSVEIEWRGHGKRNQPYSDVINNQVLGDLYKKHAQSFGVTFLTSSC